MEKLRHAPLRWLIAGMSPTPWLFPLLLPAGVLLPGWLLGRALRTPAGPAGALLGSAAVMTNLVLVFDALRLPLDTAHLAAGLVLICAVLFIIGSIRRPDKQIVATEPREKLPWPRWHWLLLPAGVGLVAIAWRAVLDPLSGFDTFFRWDFLAREMLRVGHLHFYPAVTADDYLHYSWCDGIAPLISTLYLWTYCSLGQVAAWATAPIVVAQAAILFWLVKQLATRHGDSNTGDAAVAVLAINPWLLWGIAMGQETGFTALGLVGMFYFLDRARVDPTAHWPVWAGIAAGTGALAREYGLVFIVLGIFTMAWQRAFRRGWIEFSVAAGVVASPWYMRNWMRTGNPLWSQSLGGLFPTNPTQVDYYKAVSALTGITTHPHLLLGAALALAIAVVPLGLSVVGVFSHRRVATPWLLAIATVTTLWLWSIGQTSGGVRYSLRVLTPAFALGAVLGGLWIGRRATLLRAPWVTVGLAALAVEAGIRSLNLPVFPNAAWWSPDAASWRDFGRETQGWHADPNWQVIADAAEGRKILASDPSSFTLLLDCGAKPVPFFSPDVKFLFGASASEFSTCLAHLRALGFRFIVVARDDVVMDAQISRHPFFLALQNSPPTGKTRMYLIYDLYTPAMGADRGAATLSGTH